MAKSTKTNQLSIKASQIKNVGKNDSSDPKYKIAKSLPKRPRVR